MPDVPGLPSAEELAALPHEELAARLAEAYRLISETERPGGAAGAPGGEGFGDVVEAAVVGQPVQEEGAAGPVAAGEGASGRRGSSRASRAPR